MVNGEVLLINPHDLNWRMTEVIPPISLGFLSSYVKEKGVNCDIVDLKRLRAGPEYLEKILRKKKYDVVGFHVFSTFLPSVIEYVKVVRRLQPSAFVILGGPHPIIDPEHTLRSVDVDAICVGEGENTLWQIIKYLDGKIDIEDVENIAYMKNGRIFISQRKFIDIWDTPWPDWDNLRPDTYPCIPQGIFSTSKKVAPTIATRGCPFLCTYCNAPRISGRKIRKRSPENVVGEIEYLKSKFGIEEIHFLDDNLTLDRKYIIELCHAMIDAKLGVKWACPNGVYLKSLDEEIVTLMEKAGCYSFAVGIESGNTRVLRKLMMRHTTPADYMKKLEMIKKYTKIRVTGFFILGYPSFNGEEAEGWREIIDTIFFALRSPIDRASFFIFTPYPGTPIWALKKDEIDLSVIDNHTVVKSWCKLSTFELKFAHLIANFLFWSNPKKIKGLIDEVRTLDQVKDIIYRLSLIVFGPKVAKYFAKVLYR